MSPSRYYRFNEDTRSVDPEYPKPISVWQGVPDNIKAAFMSRDQGNNLNTMCVCVFVKLFRQKEPLRLFLKESDRKSVV